MADFMKIYSPDNKTISVIDNSSGTPNTKNLTLQNYGIKYSYYSERGQFTMVDKPSDFPPFSNNMVARLDLNSLPSSPK
jgi:hypothetical protein